MQLNEHEIFENLMHESAGVVDQLYADVHLASRGFTLLATAIYPADSIYEYVDYLGQIKDLIHQTDLNMPITLRKINKLLQYLD